jgi:hypothetical protein
MFSSGLWFRFRNAFDSLAVMTTGFGFTNVRTDFCAAIGEARPQRVESPEYHGRPHRWDRQWDLLCGALIEGMGFDRGFQTMALISLGVFAFVWYRAGPEFLSSAKPFQNNITKGLT